MITKEQLLQKVKDKITLQTRIVESQDWQCCANCENWKVTENKCAHFNVTPPAKVIAVGCEKYLNDIPF